MKAGGRPSGTGSGLGDRDATDVDGAAVAIFGGRGGGVIAAGTLDRVEVGGGLRCAGFLNDFEPVGARIGTHPVLGGFSAWRNLSSATRFIARIYKAKEMPRRAEIIRLLEVPRQRWAALIDPLAVVDDDVRGVGVLVGPSAPCTPGPVG